MKKSHIVYIDLIESVAILCVIYCHYLSTLGTSIFSHITEQLCAVAVPLFLMANGALLFTRPFQLKKHLKKTLFLFISVSAWKLIYLAVTLAFYQLDWSTVSFQMLFQYLCGGNLTDPYIPAEHFWYIYVLIRIYLIFPVLKVCYDSSNRSILVFLMAILFFFSFFTVDFNALVGLISRVFRIGSYSLDTLRGNLQPLNNCEYLFYFLIGPFLHEKLYEKKLSARTKRTILFSALFGCGLLILKRYLQVGVLSGEWVTISGDYERTATLLAAIGLFGLAIFPKSIPLRLQQLLSFISQRTMNIYVVHMFLAFWYSYSFPNPPSGALVHLLRSLIILVIAIVITEPFTYIPGLRIVLGVKPVHRINHNLHRDSK